MKNADPLPSRDNDPAVSADASRSLSEDELMLFSDLIIERTGIRFDRRRNNALDRCVITAARRAGLGSIGDYYRILRQERTDSTLWDKLISDITVGETYFFRNPAHFDALRQHILPDLIDRYRNVRRLRIWSAGCSSGEEPYSLAILLRELLPDVDKWNIFILAADINRKVMAQARKGHYGNWSFRETDPAVRARYFTPLGNLYELIPRVRKMVTFIYLNLVEDAYPSLPTNTNAMDLILCRNVTIYLPEARARKMAERFYRSLAPEGHLIVGAAETNKDVYNQFEVKGYPGVFVYQKPAGFIPGKKRQPQQVRAPDVKKGLKTWKRKAIDERKVPEPVNHYHEGLILGKQGLISEAIDRFKAHLKNDPGSALAYYQIARLQANAGRLVEAHQSLLDAIERDPLLVEAYYTLALIHQEEGELDKAVTQLKKTIYIDRKFVLAYFSLANIFQQLNCREDAQHNRTQAIQLAANMPPDKPVHGSDDLTAGRLLTMVKATM